MRETNNKRLIKAYLYIRMWIWHTGWKKKKEEEEGNLFFRGIKQNTHLCNRNIRMEMGSFLTSHIKAWGNYIRYQLHQCIRQPIQK